MNVLATYINTAREKFAYFQTNKPTGRKFIWEKSHAPHSM